MNTNALPILPKIGEIVYLNPKWKDHFEYTYVWIKKLPDRMIVTDIKLYIDMMFGTMLNYEFIDLYGKTYAVGLNMKGRFFNQSEAEFMFIIEGMDRCPMCGCHGVMLFNHFECHNNTCSNFRKKAA